jgi:hypothetical protein
MLKSLLHRVFGLGRIPGSVLSSLQAEEIIFLEEGISGSITFINYRAPGRRSSWRRQWFLGAIVLTSKRVMAYGWAEQMLNISYDDPAITAVDFTLEQPERLRASFDISRFHPDRSGTIELRYSTPQVEHILNLLRQRGDGKV